MHKLTPNEYQQLVVFYNEYFRTLVDSRLTTWENVTVVLKKMLAELEPVEKKQLLAIYNNSEDNSSIKSTLTLKELDEIFREYLKEYISMPLSKADSVVKVESKISAGIELNREQIYAMTCKQREEYITRGRLEGAEFLAEAQEIQAAVSAKLANINLNKNYAVLESEYISTVITLSNLKGDHSSILHLDYSVGVELENRLREATLAKLVEKISEVIANQNASEIQDFVQQQTEHVLGLASHGEAVHDFRVTLEEYNDNLCEFMSIINLTNKMFIAVKNQPVNIMVDGFLKVCSNAEQLMTIADDKQKNIYLMSIAQRLVREIHSLVKSKSMPDASTSEFNYPLWTQNTQDLEIIERVGILFSPQINLDAGKGNIKSHEYANYITWLSLCLPAMHGSNLKIYVKALYKLQEGFINTLTKQQAATYQDKFSLAYIGDAAKSTDIDNNVMTQKYIELVLFCIDQRIDELEKTLKPR